MDVKTLVGTRLPALDLPDASAAPGGGEVPLRTDGRDATVALLLPADPPERPADYLRALGEAEAEVRRWDGRLLVIVEGEAPAERAGRVASDPDGTLRRRLGLAAGRVALVIADRFGEIYHAVEVDPEADPEAASERLPTPAALVEWLKYLTTQCPECGVLDRPGYGEWALPEAE